MVGETIGIIGGIVGIVVGLATLVVWLLNGGFKFGELRTDVSSLKKDFEKFDDRLKKNEELTHETCVKIEPLWNVIKTNLPQLLNVSRSENLVHKLSDGTINEEEMMYLEVEIKTKIHEDKQAPGNLFVDLMALWAIEVRRAEKKGKDDGTVCEPAKEKA